jgi:hypothetical protein
MNLLDMLRCEMDAFIMPHFPNIEIMSTKHVKRVHIYVH